jgi:hypothetical protein
MATLTTLRNPVDPPATTTERRINAEAQLRRNLGITDSARERVRTKLIDVPIEDSPLKRDFPRGRDAQVLFSNSLVIDLVTVQNSRSFTDILCLIE